MKAQHLTYTEVYDFLLKKINELVEGLNGKKCVCGYPLKILKMDKKITKRSITFKIKLGHPLGAGCLRRYKIEIKVRSGRLII